MGSNLLNITGKKIVHNVVVETNIMLKVVNDAREIINENAQQKAARITTIFVRRYITRSQYANEIAKAQEIR